MVERPGNADPSPDDPSEETAEETALESAPSEAAGEAPSKASGAAVDPAVDHAADPAAELERRNRELQVLHSLAQAIAESLDAEEVLRRSLDALIPTGWFDCGEALVRSDGTLQTMAVASCRAEALASCPLRRGLVPAAEAALAAGDVLEHDGWQLVPLEKRGVLALHGNEASPFFLAAVGDLVCASLKRAQLHQRLSRKEAQRSRLFRALLSAQEEERSRISRDLHDQIGQALTALLLGLDKAITAPDPEELRKLKKLVSVTLDDVRRIALDLRPSLLDELGLEAALKRYARELDERYGLRVSVLVRLPERLSHEEELVLYRVVQEALTNVVRHAHANEASVVITASNGFVQLVVEDDGVGFDPEALLLPEQVGIMGMRERLELLGGSFRIESAPGRGCAVFARLPRRQHPLP